MPSPEGKTRVFRSIEQYQLARTEGRGTKMGAVLNAVKWFLETPCASMPKFAKDGNLLPLEAQDPPYSATPWDTADKILLYSKFRMNFPLILSVCFILLVKC